MTRARDFDAASEASVLRAAKRIVIIGGSGAGKTTLALALGPRLGLPVIHLDKEHWLPGWTEPAKEDWQARHASLIAGESWILDGNYGGNQEVRFQRADCAVFLDFPTRVMLARVLRRTATTYGRVRDDMAPDCPEHLDLTFLRYVWTFKRVHAPRVRAKLAAQPHLAVVTLRTPEHTNELLAAL